jgi:hypothetical protein
MKSLYARFRMPNAHDRWKQNEARAGSTGRMILAALALTAVLGGPGALFAQDSDGGAVPKAPQVAALYELQAAFHRASTVRNPVSGDPDYVIQQRIDAVLSLWTENGWILFQTGGPRDGYYIGRGDPANPSTCPAPSGSFTNRGTLCTFFKYVAAPFQAANRFVSLAPTYKTTIGVSGNNATVYFECHFFNVAPDPTTGNPLWTATGHLAVNAMAARVEGQWLFSSMSVQPTGVPLP